MSIALLACAIAAIGPQASGSDTVAWPRRVESIVQRHLQRDHGKLWGVRLDTIPLFLGIGNRVFTSVDPQTPGFVSIGDGWWSGPLPGGIVISNTALSWANRRWAMMRLPLPEDPLEAARLVIHERWHVIQPAALPLPKYNQFDPGAALLDQPDGRIWLRLEWRALAAALDAKPNSGAETRALAAALIFRARRYAAATPSERERERLLDLDEGMPEYSGWALTRSSSADLSRVLREQAPQTPAYGRSFQYFTGPAYGYLLDRCLPAWVGQVRTTLDLQVLLASTVKLPATPLGAWLHGDADTSALAKRAEIEGSAYGLATIRTEELARWETMQRKLADLRARFLDGPTVRLRPKEVRVGMNPNRATSLGDAGTIYGDLSWKGDNGAEFSAPAGGLVDGSWSELRVPLDSAHFTPGVLAAPTRWSGNGWTLSLPAGWRVEAVGGSWLLTPRK